MELMEILQNMAIFIAVTFVVVEFLKKVIKGIVTDPPGWCFFVLSIALGVAFSYGWGLAVLPPPTYHEGFHHLNAVMTGVIIGAAASGIFSGLDEAFPGLNL